MHNETIEIISIVVLIASVLLLMRQVRIQTYQSVQQTYQSVQQNLSTIGMCLIEHPELRKYINENVHLPEPGHKDYDRAHGMIEMLLDFYEYVLEHKASLTKRRLASWKYNMKFVCETCPGMQDHMRRYDDRYSPDLVTILTQKDA